MYLLIMASAISLYPYTFGWMPSAQNKVLRSPLNVSNGAVTSMISVCVCPAITKRLLL